MDMDPICNERIRALRARIEQIIDKMNYRVVAVSSSVAGEGKTVIAANLAMKLGSTGRKKVALVDLDLRKSDLANQLGIKRSPGLSEFLKGSVPLEGIMRNSISPGLYIIPGGTPNPSPTDMIAGGKFREFLEILKGMFDIVLIDTPPILPVADTLSIRDLVDGYVMIYRAGHTPHLMFKQALEDIGEKNLIGVVLNGVPQMRDRYYKQYYGKYYQPSGNS
jgi:capsular exopolysaccharide synthesis family protein